VRAAIENIAKHQQEKKEMMRSLIKPVQLTIAMAIARLMP